MEWEDVLQRVKGVVKLKAVASNHNVDWDPGEEGYLSLDGSAVDNLALEMMDAVELVIGSCSTHSFWRA